MLKMMNKQEEISVRVNSNIVGDLLFMLFAAIVVAAIGMYYFIEYGKEHEAQCAVELETLRNSAAPFGAYSSGDYSCPPGAVLYMRHFSLTTLY